MRLVDVKLNEEYIDGYGFNIQDEINRNLINNLSSKHDEMLEKATIKRLDELSISFEDKADFYKFIKGKIYRVTHVNNQDHFEVWLNYNNKMVFLFEYSTKVETEFSYEDMKATFTASTELRYFKQD